MIVIGVIGGVASGKSVVTEQLRTLGAEVLDVDRIGHQVLRNPQVKQRIRERWGESVFAADGEVDRQALADIVFDPGNPGELAALEAITHPSIELLVRDNIRVVRSRNPVALVVDAPVMVKTGWYRMCDVLLFVDCPEEYRIRHSRTRGWTRKMFDAREASQATIGEKRKLATHVIENSGSLAQLENNVREFWHKAVTDNLPAGPGLQSAERSS